MKNLGKHFRLIFPVIFVMNLVLFTSSIAQLENCTERAEYCWDCNFQNAPTFYSQNLQTLLASFSSQTHNAHGFYNASMGQGSDRVNAIALCRGDVVPNECRDCINETSARLSMNCSNQKEGIMWAERCMVRYSNVSIFYTKQEVPFRLLPSPNPAADAYRYADTLNTLLQRLIEKASSGDSLRKFSYGNSKVPDAEEIYGFAQCTPDLTAQQCSDCLQSCALQIPSCCTGKSGARVIKPSCSLRYENNRFYNDSAFGALPNEKGSGTERTVVIIVIVCVLVVVMIVTIGIWVFLKRRKTVKKLQTPKEIDGLESLQFDFETIRTATEDFCDANKLGEGGFGAVYKGSLSDGQYVAVKRLSKTSQQGDIEFKNEVMLVAKLQHRNLVRLYGFCLEETERLLVYEFVPNASLNQFIFDPIKRRELYWSQRYKIIGGIVRGLLYLHEDSRLKVIHRDLKASNILLDEEMNAKIADFGMARLSLVDRTQEKTSRIVGTYGYMAPEYAMRGQFSVKSDVYSFGILLLEIISGRKNTHTNETENVEDLLNHAWTNWREGTALNIVDPTLGDGSRSEIMRCIHIALLCVQENQADRPTMTSIAAMLTTHSFPLPLPSQPPLFLHGSFSTQSGTVQSNATSNSRHSAISSQNEASVTSLYPR